MNVSVYVCVCLCIKIAVFVLCLCVCVDKDLLPIIAEQRKREVLIAFTPHLYTVYALFFL